MSRNASGTYALPANTAAVSGALAKSTDINSRFTDLETDANIARPIVAGGTGATTASDARTNLGLGTISTQSAGAVAITGGEIDGATIGGTTPAAINGTTGNFTGQVTIPDATAATSAVALGQFSTISGSTSPLILPNGFQIMGGISPTIAAGGSQYVTFPTAFPTACISVTTTPAVSANNTNGYSTGVRGLSAAGFNATNNTASGSVAAYWIAIGY